MMTATTSALVARLVELLHREHEAMAEFLVALAEFDRVKAWRELGYVGLFPFLERELGLSKSAAFFRMKAAQLIQDGWPINYEGAYNPDDWNAVGDIFPPLVHWKVESGQFVEYEQFQCNPQHPLCQ